MGALAIAAAIPPDPDVHTKIVRSLRLGATSKIAAGAAGVDPRVFHAWITRGRADLAAVVETPHARFALDCDTARARGDVELLAAVRAQATGIRCRACGGEGVVRRSQAGGREDDNTVLRCVGCYGSGFARKPDGRLALELLGRRHARDYGRKEHATLEVTGDGGGPVAVAVDVQALAATATIDLAGLSVEQLQALAFGDGDGGGKELEGPPAARAALPMRRSRDVIDAVPAPAKRKRAPAKRKKAPAKRKRAPAKRKKVPKMGAFEGLAAAVVES